MRALAVTCIVLLMNFVAPRARALGEHFEWQGFALGAKIGTLGPAIDGVMHLVPGLNLRGSLAYLKWDYDRTIDAIDYSLDMDFESAAALLDWYPFDGGFRISGGALFNDNTLNLSGAPNEPVEIGDHTYTPSQIGTISGSTSFDAVAPYVGIGFGNAVGPDTRWSFIFDLGVVFQTFEVNLQASGSMADNPQFQSDLQKQEDRIQDDLDTIKIYPVLAFGLAYHF